MVEADLTTSVAARSTARMPLYYGTCCYPAPQRGCWRVRLCVLTAGSSGGQGGFAGLGAGDRESSKELDSFENVRRRQAEGAGGARRP